MNGYPNNYWGWGLEDDQLGLGLPGFVGVVSFLVVGRCRILVYDPLENVKDETFYIFFMVCRF